MQFTMVNRVEREFGMVPRAVWRAPLSTRAKLCVAYLACLRDGATPYVAQIEAETGLGRDARRRAFAELEACGVISWRVERDAGGRVVARSLEFDALAVVALAEANRAPENQADGADALPPENPAGGFDVGKGRESVPAPTENQAVLREEKEKRAREARAARGRARSPQGSGEHAPAQSEAETGAQSADGEAEAVAAALGRYAAARLRDGHAVVADGSLIVPGTPHGDAVLAALVARDGEGGASGECREGAEKDASTASVGASAATVAHVASCARALTAPAARSADGSGGRDHA